MQVFLYKRDNAEQGRSYLYYGGANSRYDPNDKRDGGK